MSVDVDIALDCFIDSAPADVAKHLADLGFWRTCWPSLSLRAYHERGVEGVRWYVSGALVGTAEVWIEPYWEGCVVHVFLRGSASRPRRSLSESYARRARATLFDLKDELAVEAPR